MKAFTLLLLTACSAVQSAEILISGFIANPNGTDTSTEYVQLLATKDIDFSLTNYSVFFNNNGTATANGWTAGAALTYSFNLTSGTVSAGQVFYVGGSAKVINGPGSTDISGQTWIRAIATATVAGDGYGSANSAGILGNGGGNADGIAIFAFSSAFVTNTTVPIDTIFYGSGIGTAKPASGGYLVPDTDLYNGGVFGDSNNLFLLPDTSAGINNFTKLTGSYDPTTDTWTTGRTGSISTLSATSTPADIITGITLVPEPSVVALASILGLGLASRRRSA